jgi:ABC-2 type transport system permease protein
MGALTGTGTLVRFILRRDRILLPIWILWLGLIPVLQAAATAELFPTAAQLQDYADTLRTPALVALYGPVFGSSLGAVTVTRAGFVAVLIALMSLLTVIRHTRSEEEAGRRELLGSTVLGRHAGLAAALCVTFGANLVLAAVLALGMISQDEPAAGSIAYGLSYAAVGWMFAAVGGVTAQLTQGAGAARGIAIGVLGVAFVLRLGGDLSGHEDGLSWLSWLSPIGWGQQLRPYADERWWVLALALALVFVLVAVAAALSSRRDVGAGLLAPRGGPAVASPRFDSPLSLAWRLHRGMLAGWVAGFAALGVVLGAASQGIGDLVADSSELGDVFARMGGVAGLIDAYLAAMMGVYALTASGYAVQAALRLRSEETGLRAEPVLATSVGRLRWAASHLVFAALGPTVVLAVGGLATGLAHGVNTGGVGRELPRVLVGALVQLPAVWVMAGLAVALFGLLPRFAAAVSWTALALFLFLALIGPVLQLDQRALNLSPFTHVPSMPGGELTTTPLLWLATVAVGLAAAGLAAFRHRDLAST